MFGELPRNSIQTNLGLWWSPHIFPPLTLRESVALLCHRQPSCVFGCNLYHVPQPARNFIPETDMNYIVGTKDLPWICEEVGKLFTPNPPAVLYRTVHRQQVHASLVHKSRQRSEIFHPNG